PVLGGSCLDKKIEAAAKALAESESPGLVDPASERSMDNQLHPTTLIEEALSDYGFCGGHGAEHRSSLQDVLDDLLRSGIVESGLFFEPGDRFGNNGLRRRESNRRDAGQAITDFLPQVGDVRRQLFGSRRRLAQPEGNSRRCAVCIFYDDSTRSAFYAPDAPRRVAQQYYVSRQALDRKVFIQSANDCTLGLGYDGVQRRFRDCPATGDRR